MLGFIVSVVISLSAASSQSASAEGDPVLPDIPDNHWIFEDLYKLNRNHLIDYELGLMRGNRPETRTFIASLVSHAALNMDTLSKRLLSGGTLTMGPPRWDGEVVGLRDTKAMRNLVPEIYKLEAYFAADMPNFVDSKRMRAFTKRTAERLDMAITTWDLVHGKGRFPN
jgi:hypothetical protein